MIVGNALSKSEQTSSTVNMIANQLSHLVLSHEVIKRFNSDGQSGGAWLVTSATTGIMSNSDIGITYSSHAQRITLHVSSKYLLSDVYGNHKCPFTHKFDHASHHDTVEQAITKLQLIVKPATQQEYQLLIA
jgi:hypothetical protein